jgi:hypothetical protein
VRGTVYARLPKAPARQAYGVDRDSTGYGMVPAFHGYGASGRAEGQVVYANYAVPADFTRLEEMGISVAGKIVLARYAGAFRGCAARRGLAASGRPGSRGSTGGRGR